jgi:hypothetical protein
MADNIDVAGALFTSTYRNVKLAGKAPPPVNLEGTGTVSGLPVPASLPLCASLMSRVQRATCLRPDSPPTCSPCTRPARLQCFDQTEQSDKRAGAHAMTLISPKELPKWSGPTMTHK